MPDRYQDFQIGVYQSDAEGRVRSLSETRPVGYIVMDYDRYLRKSQNVEPETMFYVQSSGTYGAVNYCLFFMTLGEAFAVAQERGMDYCVRVADRVVMTNPDYEEPEYDEEEWDEDDEDDRCNDPTCEECNNA